VLKGGGCEFVDHAVEIEPSIEAPLELSECPRNVRPPYGVMGSAGIVTLTCRGEIDAKLRN